MALYAQGRTKPGAIVTNCDGVIKLSNHQAKRGESRWAGFGAAADLTFADDAGRPTWVDTATYKLPWRLFGTIAKAQQLVWGGDWPTMTDRPHVELFE
jgi:peptidoglycan L-alanyl-D-glutamate endopeptidase CwlK